jgi:hypothetical protein
MLAVDGVECVGTIEAGRVDKDVLRRVVEYPLIGWNDRFSLGADLQLLGQKQVGTFLRCVRELFAVSSAADASSAILHASSSVLVIGAVPQYHNPETRARLPTLRIRSICSICLVPACARFSLTWRSAPHTINMDSLIRSNRLRSGDLRLLRAPSNLDHRLCLSACRIRSYGRRVCPYSTTSTPSRMIQRQLVRTPAKLGS